MAFSSRQMHEDLAALRFFSRAREKQAKAFAITAAVITTLTTRSP
jgi:hypothetical protein